MIEVSCEGVEAGQGCGGRWLVEEADVAKYASIAAFMQCPRCHTLTQVGPLCTERSRHDARYGRTPHCAPYRPSATERCSPLS